MPFFAATDANSLTRSNNNVIGTISAKLRAQFDSAIRCACRNGHFEEELFVPPFMWGCPLYERERVLMTVARSLKRSNYDVFVDRETFKIIVSWERMNKPARAPQRKVEDSQEILKRATKRLKELNHGFY
jgi:hypothetical protein